MFVISTYWSRLTTLSPPSQANVAEEEEEDTGRWVLWLTSASVCAPSPAIINVSLFLSRENPSILSLSGWYTTLKIKLTFRARDSTSKCLNEKILKNQTISLSEIWASRSIRGSRVLKETELVVVLRTFEFGKQWRTQWRDYIAKPRGHKRASSDKWMVQK